MLSILVAIFLLASSASEASISAAGPQCLYLFNGEPVFPIPPPVFETPKVQMLEPDAFVFEVQHILGRDQFIVEKEALRVRATGLTGEIRNEFILTTQGKVVFTDFSKGLRSTDDISSVIAADQYQQFAQHVVNQDWQSAESSIASTVAAHIMALTGRQSTSLQITRASWQITPYQSFPVRVGVEHRDDYGNTRLIFDPLNSQIVSESSNQANETRERITLSQDGEVRRRRRTDRHEVIAHMSPQIAEGIMNYTYHYAAWGGGETARAVQRFSQFVRHEVPELFINDRKRMQQKGLPGLESDSSEARAYDPKRGLDQ